MTDNVKTELTEIDLVELVTAMEEMTDTGRHILARLLELHPIEEVMEIVVTMSVADCPTEYRFPDFDPNAKAEPPSDEHQRNFRIGGDSCIRVRNLSAFWLPELALKKEIGGTVYSVTGTYEGMEPLDRKLERILENNLENMEDSE